MKKLLLFSFIALFSTVSMAQTPDTEKEDLSMAEKAFAKMLFKSFTTPPLIKPFDEVEEELNIKVLKSSMYDEMGLVIMCTMDLEKSGAEMKFSVEESEEFDPATQTRGEFNHFSGAVVNYMHAVTKDKKRKVCNYQVTHEGNTFVVTYSAFIGDFDKGFESANTIVKNIRRKK